MRLVAVIIAVPALLFSSCRKPAPKAGPPTPPKTVVQSTLGDTFNILLTGRDARLIGDKSQDGKRRNKRQSDYHSDVIIIAHFNLLLPRVTLVSVPRDMLVNIPGYCQPESRTDFNNLDKITHATAYGQEPLLIKTLEKWLGIRIQRRMGLDFDSFRLLFRLIQPFVGELSLRNWQLNTPDSALLFVRNRRQFPNDDLDRSRNSVLFVKTVVQRLWKRLGNRLLNRLLPEILTLLGPDTDLTADDIRSIIARLRQRRFNPDSIETAVLIGNPAPVTIWKYGQTLSCCLPCYEENTRQVAYYLKDQRHVKTFSFMEQNQKIHWPRYVFENYDFLVPETTRVDTLNPVFQRLISEGPKTESTARNWAVSELQKPDSAGGKDRKGAGGTERRKGKTGAIRDSVPPVRAKGKESYP